MPTTCSRIRRVAGVTLVCLTLLLQGCVSDTVFTRPGADPQQIKADSSDCAEVAPVVVGTLAGGGFGALMGASASAAGAGDGAAILLGLVIGGVMGLVAGLGTSTDGAEYDRCMEARGYHPA